MYNQSLRWLNSVILIMLNVSLAFGACVIVLWLTNVDVVQAIVQIYQGAFGTQEGRGYTFYYATNFIFSGLGVALAWHAGLFNLGGEGQATLGGIGITVVCLHFDGLSLWLLIPLSMVLCAMMGGAWALIAAWLNAYRGAHIVISTIMLNFIASSLLVYLLAGFLKAPEQMAAVSETFSVNSSLPSMHHLLAFFNIDIVNTPFNISFIWALICSVGVYYYLWHTRLGFETRVIGLNKKSAKFSGISRARIVLITMMLSGALIAFIGLNEIQGNSRQLNVAFVAGFGFSGIAIALMARNNPLAIVVVSILFGALYQGGSELVFNEDSIGNNIIFLIQGLVVLFCGALQWMLKPTVDNWIRPLERIKRKAD